MCESVLKERWNGYEHKYLPKTDAGFLLYVVARGQDEGSHLRATLIPGGTPGLGAGRVRHVEVETFRLSGNKKVDVFH